MILAIPVVVIISAASALPMNDFQKNLPAEKVWAEIGGTVELPCDVTPTLPNDRVNMILWFKDDSSGIPLYSVDARGTSDLKIANHSALSSDLGGRCYFVIGPPSRLRVVRVAESDRGIFRCRVDYLNSPTSNHRVNLTLIVKPLEPQIFNSKGVELQDVAGPFFEDNTIQLICIVTGGVPIPKITWSLGKNQLEAPIKQQGRTTESRLVISPVARHFHGTPLTCQAQAVKIAQPVLKTVTLELYLKPQSVKISSSSASMSSGKSKHLICETEGSIPPANITWLIEGEPIRQAATMVAIGKNRTTSTLTLRPEWDDDGKLLTCRASNVKYPYFSLEDRRYLKVSYAPKVVIRLLSDISLQDIQEGNNLKLLCEIRANPPAESVAWFKEGTLVSRDESTTVLDINSLKRDDSGSYSCFVKNSEGATRSSPVTVTVRYAPVCKSGKEEVKLLLIKKETTEIKCEVDALPSSEIKFKWTFNNSKDVLAIPASNVTSFGPTSVLQYTPLSTGDFGTIACWAVNAVGRQSNPCLFHVVQVRPPDTPKSCAVYNKSTDRPEVKCTPGGDGGSKQFFVLEVYSVGDGPEGGGGGRFVMGDDAMPSLTPLTDPVYRLLENSASFSLHSLQPDRQYRLDIFAENAEGRSYPPVVITGVHVTSAMEKLTSPNVPNNDTEKIKPVNQHWTIIIITSSFIAFISIVCITIALSVRCRSKEKDSNEAPLNNLGPSVRIRYPDLNGEIVDEF